MTSKKASLYFSEFRRGTLDAKTSAELRQLLDSDAKLRAEFDADTRLEELIGLKRFEMPKAEAFDTFLAEFHRRQRSELVKPEPVWKTITTSISEYFYTASSSLRYAGVAALLAIVFGLSLSHSSNHGPSRATAQIAPVVDSPIANVSVVLANNSADISADYILQRVNSSPSDHGLTRFAF